MWHRFCFSPFVGFLNFMHRNPRPDPSQPYRHGYANVSEFTPPAIVAPVALPQSSISVADLLP